MIRRVLGRSFVDLGPYVDLDQLVALDEEICLGLTAVAVDYTGGSHRSLGIVPPSATRAPEVDYGQAIAAMSRAELGRFLALSDTPEAFDGVFEPAFLARLQRDLHVAR